ncbi:monocarboxylate transporter 4-like isoform X1 [Acropora palmata]|uniref:monocarboxylate transporter 4-like isoform X1 n=2 Tax=Acropora palmata TaxID=6131 RepID=UPI003DA0E94E
MSVPSRLPLRQQDSAWSCLVCFCATVLQTVSMGLATTFGVLFPVIMEHFDANRQQTARIISICIGLLYCASPLAALMTKVLNCRYVTMFGALIIAAGLTSTSFAESILIYYGTYSIMVGFGISCVRTANFLVVAKYFRRWKSLSTGIVTAGTGFGEIVFSPLTQTLVVNFGLANSLRYLAAMVFTCGFLAVVYDPDVQEFEDDDYVSLEEEDSAGGYNGVNIVDCSMWRSAPFIVFSLASMMKSAGTYVVLVHLVKYAEEHGIPSDKSFLLLMFAGISGCIGMLVAGLVTKFMEPRYVFQIAYIITGSTVLLLTIKHDFNFLTALSFVFGFAQGSGTTTSNIIFLTLVNKNRRAVAFGWANFMTSLAIVVAPPFAGFLADTLKSYKPAFYFAGSTLLIGAFLPCFLTISCTSEREPQPEVKDSEILNPKLTKGGNCA